jgi:hypothetical protein
LCSLRFEAVQHLLPEWWQLLSRFTKLYTLDVRWASNQGLLHKL